jgi:hypothetical protein
MLTRSWGKALLIAAMILAALLASAAIFQAAHADDKKAATPATAPAEADQQFAQMQEQMRAMQSQMDRLAKTEDPKERQRLLEEHWASMQKAMATMRGAWGGHMGGGPGMGGPGMGGPGMGGHMMMWKDYSELTPEQLRQRQYMMDRWMPMHQMMMDQMMQHEHWMMQPPAAPPSKK